MRGLAEYVMRGRTEAVIVSVIATGTVLFAWIGAATIALIMLRKGAGQSAQVLLWTLLPAGVLAAMGDTGPVTTLIGVMLASMVLRSTTSWSWALVAAVVSGVVTAALLLTFGQGYIEEILTLLGDTLTQLASQSKPDQAEALISAIPTAKQVAGLLGLSNAFTVIMCLMLARWWQALLYNPGGFQAEFHSLRLTPQLAVLLLLAGLMLSILGSDYRLWAAIFALPFVFTGFALVHGVMAKRQINGNWLVFFYIAWLVLDPVKGLLVVLAIADSWIDIRGRLAAGQRSE